VGDTNVVCIKSELHLNQDGIKTGEGRATLPVKDFFQQIIAEVRPSVVLTIGTADSVFDEFQLGDVVITRAAKFRLQDEFRQSRSTTKASAATGRCPPTTCLRRSA
jgi:purine-nucleoside phosphorylase